MRRSLSAVLVTLALLFTAFAASAQTKSTVQVLAIGSEDAFEQAQALTIALKRAITRTDGWTLAKGDFSLEVMTAALGCPIPPDVACQKKLAEKTGSNRYIWGTLAKKGKKEVVAVLRLWENGSQKKDVEIKYAANLTDPSDDTLMNIASDAFAKLTGEATGVVVVSAGNVNGKVFVDGKEVGTVTDGRTELTLPSGEHKILVRAEGFNDAIGTVTVRAGSSAEVTLNPTRAGSAKSGEDPTGDSARGSSKKMLGYLGVGVGGALALTGGYFWLRSHLQATDSTYEEYRTRRVPEGENVCKVADTDKVNPEAADVRDICESNARDKWTARVMVPTGAVLAGLGVYLLVTAEDGEPASGARVRARRPPRVIPLVGVGPGGGEARLHVTF